MADRIDYWTLESLSFLSLIESGECDKISVVDRAPDSSPNVAIVG